MRALLIATTALTAGLFAACDEPAFVCVGPEITPHLSPVSFGDLYVQGSDDPRPESRVAVPYEWTLLLLSDCQRELVIDEICLVADDHNGVEGDHAFTVEGPLPASIPYGQTGAIRVTYDHADPNTVDADGDGSPDPDAVALVIQSNATNYPTLIVPICGRIIPKSGTPAEYECASPIEVPAGEYRDLCRGE
ncbi:MAG: hypothetical protein CSA66_00055 [Proteobacteria bacterium]|nr:MAG: hypothetical protein CSA66_00055 [Pseudomonadota bacterium]